MATSKGEEGRDRAEDGTGGRGREAEREGERREVEGPMTLWHGAPQCLNPALQAVTHSSIHIRLIKKNKKYDMIRSLCSVYTTEQSL